MIEERLDELSFQLNSLYNQFKANKSPGLIDAIKRLEERVGNFKVGLELWRELRRVYPNYNR